MVEYSVRVPRWGSKITVLRRLVQHNADRKLRVLDLQHIHSTRVHSERFFNVVGEHNSLFGVPLFWIFGEISFGF